MGHTHRFVPHTARAPHHCIFCMKLMRPHKSLERCFQCSGNAHPSCVAKFNNKRRQSAPDTTSNIVQEEVRNIPSVSDIFIKPVCEETSKLSISDLRRMSQGVNIAETY